MNNNENLTLSPTRPYMVRAVYEWLEDNELTPYLLVDATHKDAKVPTEYVNDGRIVLNVGSRATGNMHIDNYYVNFNARFSGVSREIWVPMPAIIGIFAKEDESAGMFFNPNEYDNYTPEDTASQATIKPAPTVTAQKPRPKRENKAGLKILK